MKVGIDTLGCGHGRSGIGSYLFSLVNSLPSEDGISFELFGTESDRFSYVPGGSPISYKSVTSHKSDFSRACWHHFRLSKLIRRQKYDIVLYAGVSRHIAISNACPSVIVINDNVSDVISKKGSWTKTRWLLRSLKKADLIIAASKFIKKDLVQLGIDSEKIRIVLNGIDHGLFYPHAELESDTVLIKPFTIKRPYFLYASSLSNRSKKHVELIKGFERFKSQTNFPHRLVLAGEAGNYLNEVTKAIKDSPFASDIFVTGYFPHDNLSELCACANAFIFPAVKEGVGLPVLEAMATGVPVCCAKTPALSEIAGESALYFDPDSIEETAKTLEQIVSDEKLRQTLIESGLERARRFTWDKTAQRTLDVLKEVTALE